MNEKTVRKQLKHISIHTAFDADTMQWESWNTYADGTRDLVGFGNTLTECLKKTLYYYLCPKSE